MGNSTISSGVAILTAIVGLAILSVVLAQKSDSARVVQTAGGAFQAILRKAVSPISN